VQERRATNRLRIASVIVLLVGLALSLYGYQAFTKVYGCVPPVNGSCISSAPVPPTIAYGGYAFYFGIVMTVGSLVGLALSFRHPSKVNTEKSEK